jgi:L-rhamnose mutarotase
VVWALSQCLWAVTPRDSGLGRHPLRCPQLFAYAEIESVERWSAVARTPVCQRWWRYMGEVMPFNPDSSPVAAPLKEVFHLD